MSARASPLTAALFLITTALPLGSSEALAVRFEAVDLNDSVPGEDRWEYRYFLENGSPFAEGQGFAVLFDPSLYDALEPVPSSATAWDILALQPDPELPDFGAYDAQAVADAPPLGASFRIQFVWEGSGAPSSQPFVVYDGDLSVLEAGETQLVPEPAGEWLTGVALLGLGGLLLRRRRAARAQILATRGAGANLPLRHDPWRRTLTLAGVAALPVLLGFGIPTPVVHEVDLGDFILRYQLVATERVGRTVFDYRYESTLESGGPSAENVKVNVTSGANATALRDDQLVFGNVPSGETVASRDTFTLQQDRTVFFDPGALTWELETEAIPTVPDYAGTVGPEGGMVDALRGRVRLDFASGAVAEQTDIRVTPIRSGFNRVPVVPETAHDFGPDAAHFDPPVILTLSYDDEDLPDGFAEEDLAIARFEETGWIPIPGSRADPFANTVTAEVESFSTMGLVDLGPHELPTPDTDPGGELDPAFGSGGRVVMDLGSAFDEANALALQEDGRIVVAGSTFVPFEGRHFVALRFSEAGVPDTSFGGGDGVAPAPIQFQSNAFGIALQRDAVGAERIVLVGGSTSPPPDSTDTDPALARFLPDGSLDRSFGGTGVVTFEFIGDPRFGIEDARDVVAEPDGKLLVLSGQGLLRYEFTGDLDPQFGDGGVLTGEGGCGIERRASGFFVVAGCGPLNHTKYKPDGDFSQDETCPNSPERPRGQIEDLTTRPTGFLMSGGSGRGDDSTDSDVVLFVTNGTFLRCASFGGDGVLVADFGGNEEIQAVAAQDDFRAVAVGATDGPQDRDLLVTRFTPDGFIDTEFGDEGKVLLDFGGEDVATDVAIDAEGRIVVVGTTTEPGDPFDEQDIVLARILP